MLEITKTAQIQFNAPKFTSVTAIIDAPGITVDSSTYGGYEFIARPQAEPLANFVGLNPLQLNIPIFLGDFGSSNSVEAEIRRLDQFAGRRTGERPEYVTLKTLDTHQALLRWSDTVKWVITNIEWGDYLSRTSDGHRTRQAATVTVVKKVDPTIKILSASRRAGNSRRHTTHIVKKGETLQKVSIIEYGTADRWQDIAKANSIHDPRNLKPGTKLKLPK